MKLSEFIVGIMIVGIVITGFLGFFTYLNSKYPNTYYVADDTMAQYQAQVNATEALTRDTQAQLTNLKPTSSALDILNSYFGGAYTAVITAVGSYGMFSSMAQLSFAKLGVPDYIVFGLLAIVTIYLIFILVRIVTKVE